MVKTGDILITLSNVGNKEKAMLDFSNISIKSNDTIYLHVSNGEIFEIIKNDIPIDLFLDWIAATYNTQPNIDAIASKDGSNLVFIGNDLDIKIDFGNE